MRKSQLSSVQGVSLNCSFQFLKNFRGILSDPFGRWFRLLTLLSLAMIVSACGGGGGGASSSTSPAAPNSLYLAAPTTQAGASALTKDVQYSTRHFRNHVGDSIKLFLKWSSEEIVSFNDNFNYQLNDTIEFSDTVIRVTSIIDQNTLGFVRAEMFDVFDKLEISGDLTMSVNGSTNTGNVTANGLASPQGLAVRRTDRATPQSVSSVLTSAYQGAKAARDSLDALVTIAQEIKDRGCLPTLSDVTVIGIAGKHSNGVGKFLGRGATLTNCKLYEDATGTVSLNQSIYVGAMSSGLRISKKDLSFKFLIDGAYFLDGKITVNTHGSQVTNTKLLALTPDISASLPASEAATLSKLLSAEIFINLKTKIAADKINAEVAYQTPGDFAIGVQGQFDSTTKKWRLTGHKLTSGNYVDQDQASTDASLAITEFKSEIGSGIEVGYQVRLSADSPYIDTSGSPETWYTKWLQDAKAGFSGELHVFAKQAIGAGLVIDAFSGTKVPVGSCRLNLSSMIGYYSIFAFQGRVGSQVYADSLPDDLDNVLFLNAANTIGTWDLFKKFPATFKVADWCGPTAKLGGYLGNVNKSEIRVMDNVTAKTLATTTYVFDNYLGPANSQLSLKATPQDATVGSGPSILADTNGAARYDIEVDNTQTEFDPADPAWIYLWNTLNTDVSLNKTNSPKASFSVKCRGVCDSTKPIVLSMIAPNGKRYVFPFYINFDYAPKAAGNVIFSATDMTLDAATSNDDSGILTYMWESPSGLIRRTAAAIISLKSDEDFYKDVVANGKVSLVIEDTKYQSNRVDIAPVLGNPVVAPRALVFFGLSPTTAVGGVPTVFSVAGTNFPLEGLGFILNGCGSYEVLSKSSILFQFRCTMPIQTFGASWLFVIFGRANENATNFNVFVGPT